MKDRHEELGTGELKMIKFEIYHKHNTVILLF